MLHLHIQDTTTNKSGDIQVEKTSNIVQDSVFISDILKVEPERDYIIIVLNFRPRYNDVDAVLEFIRTYDNLINGDREDYYYPLSDLMRLWWSASILQINFEVEEKLARIIYDEIFSDNYTKEQVVSILYDGDHAKDPHLDLYLTKFHGYNKIVENFRLPIGNKVFFRNLISDKTVSYDRSTSEIILYNKLGRIIKTINVDGMPVDTNVILTYDDHIILHGFDNKKWYIDVTQCIEDFGSVENDNKEYTEWLNKFFSDSPYNSYDNRSNRSLRDNDDIILTPDATKVASSSLDDMNPITKRYWTHPYRSSVSIEYQNVDTYGNIINVIRNGETVYTAYLYYKNVPSSQRYPDIPYFKKENRYQTGIRISPDEKLIMFHADGNINIINIETKSTVLQLNVKLLNINPKAITLFNSGLIFGVGRIVTPIDSMTSNEEYYIVNLDGSIELIGDRSDWKFKIYDKYSLLYNNGEVVKFGSNMNDWFKELI